MHPDLVLQIDGSIFRDGTGVQMTDVIGLDGIKRELLETINLPKKFLNAMADRGVNNTFLLFGVSTMNWFKVWLE